jgi:phosphoribosylamine--glycine ligase
LEGSKAFTKQFCDEFHIPTAAYRQFDRADAALDYVRIHGAPIVVKADGLAAGKGVVVADTVEEATAAVIDCFDGKFGSAGAHLVLEDKLSGREVSYFALCDGQSAVPFGIAQDHKRVGDGDTGPNTGGMGAFSPVPFVSAALSEQIFHEIISPTLAGMRCRGTPFRGVLFAGLMIGESGPMLIEFNVRFGDPEAQVLLQRVQGDTLELFFACAKGDLGGLKAEFSQDTAVGVVMASRGYPDRVEKGSKISGLNSEGVRNNARVFQGATRREGEEIYADGGRVLTVVGSAPDLVTARDRAYAAVRAIDWPSAIYRRDIALRSVSTAPAFPEFPGIGKVSN